MPAVTPAEPPNLELCGCSIAIQPARLRTPPQPAEPCRGGPACPPPLFLSPCSLCPLWFAFSCPPWFVFSVPSVSSVVCFFRALRLRALPTPQSQPSPNLFSFPFQPLAHSSFLLLLLLSCMLKVKGAADALVGARTADGASPGQRRRRPQPLPSPDGGELRSLKPAAGGEQAGGGLLT